MLTKSPKKVRQENKPTASSGTSQAGSAAIYGFLFQLTASMAQIVKAQFGNLEGQSDPETVTAIIEPLAGGDLSIDAQGQKKVVQFKHRSRRLAPKEVSDSVLPDLFRFHCTYPADVYELQCSKNLSDKAIEAVKTITKNPIPDPSQPKNVYVSGAHDLCKAIFDASPTESLADFETEYCAFISRFQVGATLRPEDARSNVLRWLRRHIAYAEDADSNFDQLVGYLLGRARTNDAEISVEVLLSQIGLRKLADARPEAQQDRLNSALREALKDRRFDTRLDVRQVISVSEADQLTLISGASGHGKSWSLYRLADDFASKGCNVLLIQAQTLSGLREQMRKVIALDALGIEKPIEPSALGKLWRRASGRDDELIWVLWEGCRNPEDLSDVQRQGGLGEGLRLVAELPAFVDAATAGFPKNSIIPVGLFTEIELFEALGRRGVQAGNVPSAIRQMLLLPVLCGIYAAMVSDDSSWNPSNEYLVLQEFWARAQHRAGALTGTRLKKLARRMLKLRVGTVIDDVMAELEFTDTQLSELITTGWLANIGANWSFAHDRLLTWAIAEALTSEFQIGTIEPAALAQHIDSLQGTQTVPNSLSHLGFLLMDVIWLASAQPQHINRVAELLRHLESEKGVGTDTLYQELLPTAGIRILPAVLARVELLTDTDVPRLLFWFETCLKKLDLTEEQRQEVLNKLWKSETQSAKSLALILGAHWPLNSYRDQIWQDYIATYSKPERDHSWYEAYSRMELAAKCLVRADPSWLRHKLLSTNDPLELWCAANFLKAIDISASESIWADTKEHLFVMLPKERHDVLVRCIGLFSDRSRIDFLLSEILAGGEFATRALGILAVIEPQIALTSLSQYKNSLNILPRGRTWLDHLLDCNAIEASASIRNILLEFDPSGKQLAIAWRSLSSRLDEPTVHKMMELLASSVFQTEQSHDRAASELLETLALLPPSMTGMLERYRGTDLSKTLVERAKRHLSSETDESFSSIEMLLRRLGGDEYEQLILFALGSDQVGLVNTGVNLSYYCPTPAVIAKIEALADASLAEDITDEARIEVWRSFLALTPRAAEAKMLELLLSSKPQEVLLGLYLIDEDTRDTYREPVLSCLKTSEPGTEIESIALNLAAQLAPDEPILCERGIRLLNAEGDNKRISALNALLKNRSIKGRAELDAYLGRLITATSWSSTDIEALAIRLSQENVDETFWKFAERWVRSPSMFGGRVLQAFVMGRPAQAKAVLIERAFSPPHVFTSAQPDAIRMLASLDMTLATQAFENSWVAHPDRRQHLAKVARVLSDGALSVMVDHIVEAFQSQGINDRTFRRVCFELRCADKRSLPLLMAAFEKADSETRNVLCEAIGWTRDSLGMLERISRTDEVLAVREKSYQLLQEWKEREAAWLGFRQNQTLENLDHAISIIDPAILCMRNDPWSVVELVQTDTRLTVYAERMLAQRYNKVSGSHLRRLALRPVQDAR